MVKALVIVSLYCLTKLLHSLQNGQIKALLYLKILLYSTIQFQIFLFQAIYTATSVCIQAGKVTLR